MTDDLRNRIATALMACEGATTWDAMAGVVLTVVQPIADELAENEGVIKALRRQRDQAEATTARVRAQAADWAGLETGDDWGPTPTDTVLADAGRYLLALIDQPERIADQAK